MASRRSSKAKKALKPTSKKRRPPRQAAKKSAKKSARSRLRRQPRRRSEKPVAKKARRGDQTSGLQSKDRQRERSELGRACVGRRRCCLARTCRSPAARTKRRPRARAIGASAMQIFTKMANRWADRVCEGDECAAFRDGARRHARARHDRARLVSHQPREPRRRCCAAGRSNRSSPSCSDARRSD